MRLPRALRWSTASRGMNTLRIGALALLAAAALSLCGLALDDAIYQPVRELPGKWVDGHFQSERFWIAGRATRYVIDLEVPDTRVSTLDSEVDLPDQHFTQRCGRPFSEGVTWSLRRFGRVMTQHTSADQPWCEDASVEHALRAAMGSFQASPGPGYSIRIETRERLPLRLSLRTETGQDSGFAVPAAFLRYALVSLGILCLPLGAILMLMERFKIVERLAEHLQRRRDDNPLI